MLLRSIRSRLIGLVVASVVPFTALIGVGLWNQWRTDQKAAIQRAVNEARLIAAQVDDHIGNLKNLLSGVSVAVSWDPKDTDANDRMLRQGQSPSCRPTSPISCCSRSTARNIGTSSDAGRIFAGDRDYFLQIVAGQRRMPSATSSDRAPGNEWVVTIARPIVDADGGLRAVLAVGTRLERFQDALDTRAASARQRRAHRRREPAS